jgi:hypothetical protein
VVEHLGDAGHPSGRGPGLQVLGVARYGAVEGDLAADVLDDDVGRVDPRVEVELGLDGVAYVLGLAHLLILSMHDRASVQTVRSGQTSRYQGR